MAGPGRKLGQVGRKKHLLLDALQVRYGEGFNTFIRQVEIAVAMQEKIMCEDNPKVADMQRVHDSFDKINSYLYPKMKSIDVVMDDREAGGVQKITREFVNVMKLEGGEVVSEEPTSDSSCPIDSFLTAKRSK